ncbi:MAG: cysteine hydrolase [Pseudonocardia sp.]|nr:cysteine hydrolase [Pseudonocardia sp.]
MEHAFGLDIPRTLQEACHPARTALVVYDMQVGVVGQIADGAEVTRQVVRLVTAARAGGFRVVYLRHMFPPPAMSGVAALRTAMAWQRVESVSEVRPFLTRDAPGFALVPELQPTPDELVLDKITMSAFEATPLDIVLRDCRLDSFVIAGVAMEVGIEPTVRHALDLGYLPIVVADACGAGHPEAAARSRATLEYAGGSLWTDTDTVQPLLDIRSP